MSRGDIFRSVIRVVLISLLCFLPLVSSVGLISLLAVAVTLTVYTGLRTRTVYGSLVVLSITDALYPGTTGVLMVAYTAIVAGLLAVRRFVSIPVWADRDGWSMTDLVQTVLVSWLATLGAMIAGLVAADMMYGESVRFGGVVNATVLLAPLVVSLVSVVIVRRLAIPFRRAILFGV